ncbi:MAG: peptidylprolyl isomerase [bacterium]|nr:peptidylprolyl isomerase [bacterium]
MSPSRSSKILLILSLISSFMILSASENGADKIFAFVNDSIILKSEYDQRMAILENTTLFSKEDADSLKREMLDIMVNDKILQIIADKDSISIDTNLLTEDVERRIFEAKKNFKSDEEFLSYLKQNNLTEEALKKNYLDQAMKMALKQQIIVKNQLSITVNENEMKSFYEENKDSFFTPLSADLYHITVVVQPDSAAMFAALQKIESVFMYVKSGNDLGEAAKDYSEDKSAKNRGIIGYVKYTDLPSELAAFLYMNMNEDTLLVTQSREGFHLIKILGAKADSVKFQQVLVRMPATKSDSLDAKKRAEYVVNEIKSNKLSFEDAAKKYSDDPSTKSAGGFLGRVAIEMLSDDIKESLKNLEPDSVSNVILGDFGYEIFMMRNKEGGYVSEYKDIKNMIASIIENTKVEKEINRLIDKERKRVLVKVLE